MSDKSRSRLGETLLEFPFVHEMLNNPSVKVTERGIDRRWFYEDICPIAVIGFNPVLHTYYARNSYFAQWLKNPKAFSVPKHHVTPFLKEFVLTVHDYFHAWLYLAIAEMVPRLEFGTGPIHKKNLEDLAFCHMLTEAVAVATLDYWFLCGIDLRRVLGVSTDLAGATTPFHYRDLFEYRKYFSDFDPMKKEFLTTLVEFYCSGNLPWNLSTGAVGNPVVYPWLKREMGYQGLQRKFSRQWVAHLSGDQELLKEASHDRPMAFHEKWKRKLVADLGERCWNKIHGSQDEFPRFEPNLRRRWHRPVKGPLDFRFMNLNRISESPNACLKVAESDDETLKYYFFQRVQQLNYSDVDPRLRKKIKMLKVQGNFKKAIQELGDRKPLKPSPHEPLDLFVME